MADLTGVQVGRAGLEDARELLGLINLVQPHVPWDEKRLSWQFFEPPAGPANLWVIRDGEAVVSLYAAIQQSMSAEGGPHLGWMIQDVMSHPAYRGRGFLHHLGQLCFDEIRAAGHSGYTFPNKQSEGSFRRIGWSEVGRVPLRLAAAVAPPVRSDTAPVAPLGAFTPLHNRIWDSAHAGAGVRRDSEFLEWRYRKPGQRYMKYSVAGDQGFLVLKVYEGGDSRTLHICDLVVRPDARELLPGVLGFVFAVAQEEGAARVTAWLPADHIYGPDFDAAGLTIDATHDRFMFATGPAAGLPWHVTQGDSDVY